MFKRRVPQALVNTGGQRLPVGRSDGFADCDPGRVINHEALLVGPEIKGQASKQARRPEGDLDHAQSVAGDVAIDWRPRWQRPQPPKCSFSASKPPWNTALLIMFSASACFSGGSGSKVAFHSA
jgi:hypothetical protein